MYQKRWFMYPRGIGGGLIFLLLLSCTSPKVLWVSDSLWEPLLEARLPKGTRIDGKGRNLSVDIAYYSFQEMSRIEIEQLLTKGKYSYGVVSPFAVVDLLGLIARFPETIFICMDAPIGYHPLPNLIGVSFDPLPALKEALQGWEVYAKAHLPLGKSTKLIVVSDNDLPLFNQLGFTRDTEGIHWQIVSRGEREDEIRNRLRLIESLDVWILWSSLGGIALEGLVKSSGSKPKGIIGLDIDRLPALKEIPFTVNIYRNYSEALAKIISKTDPTPQVFPYSVSIPRFLFDKDR